MAEHPHPVREACERVAQIFLNYRNEDDTLFGVAMLDRELSAQFGDDEVFLASKSIELGAEWEREMFQAVADSTALLVIMGRNWLDARNEDGRRRIDDPADFVRREILTALDLGKQVIPVRLAIGRFRAEELPVELRPLVEQRQDIEIRFRSHRVDIELLARKLRKQIPSLGKPVAPPVTPAGKFAIHADRIGSAVQSETLNVEGDFVIGRRAD